MPASHPGTCDRLRGVTHPRARKDCDTSPARSQHRLLHPPTFRYPVVPAAYGSSAHQLSGGIAGRRRRVTLPGGRYFGQQTTRRRMATFNCLASRLVQHRRWDVT